MLQDRVEIADFQFSDLVKETVFPANLAMCMAGCEREKIYISIIKCFKLLRNVKKLFFFHSSLGTVSNQEPDYWGILHTRLPHCSLF